MEPLKLVKILKDHRTFIQTHNFPDPDAIASAFGLQYFLKQHGIETQICYEGKIDKLSTRKMFEVFGIEAMDKEHLSISAEDFIITVDSQKYNTNLTDLIGDEVACVDHHPTVFECEYRYKDVRITGACSSIIAHYYFETNTSLNDSVAAALAYGIKMDTADFIRGVTDLDIDMFAFVYKQADISKLKTMYSNVMEFSDLQAYAAAIESIHVYDNIGFAEIPFDCPDALIAIISDFILSLDIVDISIIYAIRKDGIKFSIRSEIAQIDAGAVISDALSGYGSGGGHKSMAGGFIPKKNIQMLGEKMRYQIETLFMKRIEEKQQA